MSEVATSETRNEIVEPACRDLCGKGQSNPFMASETRKQAQKPAHKDIRPKWQNQPFGSDATYAPVSNRA